MSKKKEILIGVAITGALIFCLAVTKYWQISSAMAANANQGPPPEAVTSFVAEEQEWPKVISAVGSLSSVQGATLSAEETGRISRVNFESGSAVKAGDILVEIDAAVEKAQLEGVQAQLELAEITARRQRALRERGANAQSDLDAAEANLRDLKAEANRLQAIIERKQIIAPFDGTAGIRQVNIGQTVNQGDAIITLNAYDSLFYNFTLPQTEIGKLSIGDRVELSLDAYPGEVFEGQINAIESEVNPRTRNFGLQAVISNPDEKLRAGMFASAAAYLPEKDRVIAIPASSIRYAPYGNSVWIIGAGEAGKPRPANAQVVRLGRRLGELVEIEKGLSSGQEIVSSGLFKMRPGVQVIVNNVVQPGSQRNPNPKDT